MAEETSDKNNNPSIGLPDKIRDQEGKCKMVNGEESNVINEACLPIENKPVCGAKNKQHTAFMKNKKKTNLKKINEDANEVKDDLGKICKGQMKEMVGAELSEREITRRKADGRALELKHEGQGDKKGRRQDKEQSEKKSPPSCSIASNVDQTTSRTYIGRVPMKFSISSNEKTARGEQNDAQNQVCCHGDERKENSILTNKKFLKCASREKNDVVGSNHNWYYIERYTSCSSSNVDRKKTGNVDSGENNPAYVRRPHLEQNFCNQRIIKNGHVPNFDKYCPYEKNCADHMDGRNMYHSSGSPGTNRVVNGVNRSANDISDCSNFGYVNIVSPPDGLSNHHSYHQQKQQLDANSKEAQTHISSILPSERSQNDLCMNTANVQHHHVMPPYVHPLGNKEQGIRIGAYPKDRFYNKGKEKIHDQYYRIKLCPFLKKGLCQKGDNCSYAHSIDTLRSCMNLMKTKICQLWLKNECRNPNCVYAHGEGELRATPDYFKTKLCKYFDKEGTCPSGDKCRHAHGQAELRQRNYRKTEFEKNSPKSKVSTKFTFNDLRNKGECSQYILNMLSGRSRKENVHRSDWNNWNETNGHNGFSNGSRYNRDTRMAAPTDENSNAERTSGGKGGALPDQMCRPEKRERTNEITQVYHVSAAHSCTNQEKGFNAVFTVFERKEKSHGAKNSYGSSANVCGANYSDQRKAPREEQIFKADKENAPHEDTPHLHNAVSGTISSITLERDGNGKKEQRDHVVEGSMGNGASEASRPEQRADIQKERKSSSSSVEPLSKKNQNLSNIREPVQMKNEEIEVGPNAEQHPVGKSSHSGDMNGGYCKMLREAANGGEKKEGTFAEVMDKSSEHMSSGRSSSQYMSIGRNSNEGEDKSCWSRSPNKSYGGCNQDCHGENRWEEEDENNGQMRDEIQGTSLLEVEIGRQDDRKYECVEIGDASVEEYPQARRSETRHSFEGDKNENGNVDRGDNAHQYSDENENGRGDNGKQRDRNQEQERQTLNEYRFTRHTNEMDNCSMKVNCGENIIQRHYPNNCPRGGGRYGSFRNFKESGNDIQRSPIFTMKNQYRKENDGKKNLLLSKLASCHTESTPNNYDPKNFNYKYKKFNMASRYTKHFERLDHYGSVANVASYGNCDREGLNNGGELINNEGTQNGSVIGGSGRGNALKARGKKGNTHGEHNKLIYHNEPKGQMTNCREDKNYNDIPHRYFTCKSSHRSFNNTYSPPDQNPSNQNFENAARCSHTNHNHANNSLHMQNVLPRPKETYSNVCNSVAHRTNQTYGNSNGTTSNDMLYGHPVYPLNTLVNNFSYYNYNVSNVSLNRNNCYSYLNVELNSVNMASQMRVLPAELSISVPGGGTTEEAYRAANQAANTTDMPSARNNRAHNRSAKSHPCSNQHRKKILNNQNMGSNPANMHFSGNQSANVHRNNNRKERNCTSSNVVVGCSHHRSSFTESNTHDNCVQNGNCGSLSASNMAYNDRSDPSVGSFRGNSNSWHGVSEENDLSGDNSCSGSHGENPNVYDTQISQNGGRENRKRTPHLPYSSHRNYEKTNSAHFKNYRNYNNHVCTNQVCTNQVYSNHVYANHPAYGSNQAYYSNQVYTYQHPYSNYIYNTNGHTHSSSSHPYNNSSSAYVMYPYSSYPYSISYHHSGNYPYDDLYTYDGACPHDAVQPYNSVNPYNGNTHCDSVQPYGSAPHYSINPYYGDVEQFSGGQLYGGAQLYSGGQIYIDAQQCGDADQCANIQPYGGDHYYNGNRSGVHNGSYTNDQSYVYNQYPYNAIMNYGPPYNSNDTEEGQNGNCAPLRDGLLDNEEYQNRPNENGNNANDTCQDESAFDDLTKSASTEEGDEAAEQSPLQSPAVFQQ
ncbi:Uncharacterized protein PCOAH_00026860 [Plasmodium coatneyi]|uniref:C3H1-type domain-containing protein n=1 Tax=Plasmodium coatneyi TaxID=208452 RepID=A0A1B1E045_9APIC|nr:Uncharacterized protein PCOAH_00026860 [Plasmodium coatneyi]ANQ08403.1 Uncharacterized protein PCOAH_00026860 [Plasmodium coatneyi]